MKQERGAAAGTRNFALVQALRGIAASWVVLFHAFEGGHIPALHAALPAPLAIGLFDLGHYGVAIFFALSGFVIAHSIRDAAPSFAFLGRFALRRSIRLDPPYWTAILGVVVVGLISARVKGEAFALPGPNQLAAHLFYLQELLRYPEINSVFWTLTFEIQFYLFFAAALVLAGKAVRAIGPRAADAVVWSTFYLLALAGALGWTAGAPQGVFVLLWHHFFIGALAYRAIHRRDARPFLGLLVVVMLVTGGGGLEELFGWFSAATAALLFVATVRGGAERGLSQRPFQFLGSISYSLYLLHNPVTGAAGFVAHRVAGQGLAADLLALAVIVAASVAAAAALWATVERASHRWSRRIALPKAKAGG